MTKKNKHNNRKRGRSQHKNSVPAVVSEGEQETTPEEMVDVRSSDHVDDNLAIMGEADSQIPQEGEIAPIANEESTDLREIQRSSSFEREAGNFDGAASSSDTFSTDESRIIDFFPTDQAVPEPTTELSDTPEPPAGWPSPDDSDQDDSDSDQDDRDESRNRMAHPISDEHSVDDSVDETMVDGPSTDNDLTVPIFLQPSGDGGAQNELIKDIVGDGTIQEHDKLIMSDPPIENPAPDISPPECSNPNESTPDDQSLESLNESILDDPVPRSLSPPAEPTAKDLVVPDPIADESKTSESGSGESVDNTLEPDPTVSHTTTVEIGKPDLSATKSSPSVQSDDKALEEEKTVAMICDNADSPPQEDNADSPMQKDEVVRKPRNANAVLIPVALFPGGDTPVKEMVDNTALASAVVVDDETIRDDRPQSVPTNEIVEEEPVDQSASEVVMGGSRNEGETSAIPLSGAPLVADSETRETVQTSQPDSVHQDIETETKENTNVVIVADGDDSGDDQLGQMETEHARGVPRGVGKNNDGEVSLVSSLHSNDSVHDHNAPSVAGAVLMGGGKSDKVRDLEAGITADTTAKSSSPDTSVSRSNGRSTLIEILIVLVILLIGAVIGLSIGLVKRGNSRIGDTSSIQGGTPSLAPMSNSPTSPISRPAASPPTGRPSRMPAAGAPSITVSSTFMPSIFNSTIFPSIAPSNVSSTAMPSSSFSPSDPPTILPTASITIAPSSRPSIATSIAPSGILGRAQAWVIEQNYSSPESLLDPLSPQSEALAFMADDPLELPNMNSTTEEQYQWVQRYAFSVFFYALGGDNWTTDLRFVDHNLSTCEWFSAFTRPPLDVLGVGCNDNNLAELIRIVDNNLAGTFPIELGQVTTLKLINLQQNSFITGGMESLQSLTSLEQFSCLFCSLAGPLPAWLGEQWGELTSLGLSQNAFTGTLPETLSMLSNLSVLALDDNLLSGGLEPLQNMTSLGAVYLDNNDFSGTIDSDFFANAMNLARLDISNNNFVGSVPIHLMEFERISIMDLHSNKLTIFEDAIPERSTLEMLALHRNPFQGTFPSSTISNLVSLSHLDITTTTFNGTMPEGIGSLTNLTYLFLADTLFAPGAVPDSFQNLSNLVDLSLKKSTRTGTIPSWIVDINNLVLMDLHNNFFTGTIPVGIGAMRNLGFLLLNRNRLTGTIPVELSLASKLQIILIDGNSLTGSLDPVCEEETPLAASADCRGVAPDVECSCCNICCSGFDSECNNNDFLAQYDPTWETDYQRNQVYDFNQDVGIV